MALTKSLSQHCDVELVLNTLGLDYEVMMSDEVRLRCPFHKEEEPSLFINQTKKIYHCLGCNKSGTFVNFIRDLKGWSYEQTTDFLKKLHGLKASDIEELAPLTPADRQSRDDMKKLSQINHVTTLPIIDGDWIYNCRTDIIPYLSNRGFTQTTLKDFRLGFCTNGHYKDRIIIPIYDEYSRLVGYSSRNITDEKDTKYKHKAQLDKHKLLYNLNNAKEYVSKMPLMLCEGFSDVWRATEYGYSCAVAVMGDCLSLEQEKLALRYGYKFIVAFDGDKPGLIGAIDAVKRLKVFAQVYLFVVPNGKDIGSLTKPEFVECLKDSREVR